MDDLSFASPAFWRGVRWCDQRLIPYQRRLLLQAWLPTVLGERLPWHPLFAQMQEAAEAAKVTADAAAAERAATEPSA